jgi:hypothetical protein
MGIGMTMLLPSSSAPHASPYRLAYRTLTDRAERLGAGSLFAMNAVYFAVLFSFWIVVSI